MKTERIRALPCEGTDPDRGLLKKYGSQQALLSCRVELFDFEVYIRRHRSWGTYTIGGVIDLEPTEDSNTLISSIVNISIHQVQFYRAMQRELFLTDVNSAIHSDGFLDLGKGRWFYVGAAMASYNTNEYRFDFDMDEHNETTNMMLRLIEEETWLCALTLWAACHAFLKIVKGKWLTEEPVEESASSVTREPAPYMKAFIDHERTEEVNGLLRKAHRSLQIGDAHLYSKDEEPH